MWGDDVLKNILFIDRIVNVLYTVIIINKKHVIYFKIKIHDTIENLICLTRNVTFVHLEK